MWLSDFCNTNVIAVRAASVLSLSAAHVLRVWGWFARLSPCRLTVPTHRGMLGQGWDPCLKCLVRADKPTPTARLFGGGAGRPKGPHSL